MIDTNLVRVGFLRQVDSLGLQPLLQQGEQVTAHFVMGEFSGNSHFAPEVREPRRLDRRGGARLLAERRGRRGGAGAGRGARGLGGQSRGAGAAAATSDLGAAGVGAGEGVGRGGGGRRRGGQGERGVTEAIGKSFPRLFGGNGRWDRGLFGVSPDHPLPTGVRGTWSRTGEGLWVSRGLGCGTRGSERQLGRYGWSLSPSSRAHWWSPILSWGPLPSADLG